MTSTEAFTTTVQTSAGSLRGETADGIQAFRGIPYGAPTGGANRFMAPRKPEPWAGVRDALTYGPIAPQLSRDGAGSANPIDDARGNEGEDCLVLNVFTPGTGDGSRRPVMFWCHGGGFISGSGGAAYDGSNLARRGDVVVVSINHRLNALGFLHLREIGGPEFASSGNAGMLDIVAALEWVRDNIAAFGGDPGNVTVFGESGGGRKTAVLMAMPAAKGLFHRAIIQSGPELRVNEAAYATQLAEAVLSELGVKPGNLEEIQRLPLGRIMAAQSAASAKMPSSNARGGFRPVMDGAVLPSHPFTPPAPGLSADVPLMVGFNRTEATLFLANDKEAFELDETGLQKRVSRLLRERSEEVIQEMRALYPDASPSDLYIAIHTGFLRYPIDSIRVAERKAAQGGAPAYHYTFEWESPARWGKLKTPHALEIPFVFDNVAVGTWATFTRATPEAHTLAAKVSATWAAFARTGDPNSGDLPRWEPYSATERKTMLIDNESRLASDPRPEERQLWEQLYKG
ncbi:MAG: carboxylesterase/lipase family protein [Dehalococcoidia bacterium]|nr:carboxylesterase/lipase family protein [Dehalococcoidia bacterium]